MIPIIKRQIIFIGEKSREKRAPTTKDIREIGIQL